MMFWYGNNGWHPWVAVLMWVGMVVFWALIVWGAFALFRAGGRDRGPERDRGPDRPDPEAILKERLARGEIDAEEYRRRRDLIRSG